MAGCASAPTAIKSEPVVDQAVKSEPVVDQAVNVDQSFSDGPVGLGVHPDRIARCRKEAPTGSHVQRRVCGPKKDDIKMLGVIRRRTQGQ